MDPRRDEHYVAGLLSRLVNGTEYTVYEVMDRLGIAHDATVDEVRYLHQRRPGPPYGSM